MTRSTAGDKWAGFGMVIGLLIVSYVLVIVAAFYPQYGILPGLSTAFFFASPFVVYHKLKHRYPVVAKSFRISALLLFVVIPVVVILGALVVCLSAFSNMGH